MLIKDGDFILDVTLYSTNCPKCNVIKKLLDKKHIAYDIVTDKDIMLQKGFTTVPVLDVDDCEMGFKEAFNYIGRM